MATGWMWLNPAGVLQANQDFSFNAIERPLAQSQHVYVVIHPNKQVMWIKARGFSVRKFWIQSMQWIGEPIAQSSVFSIEHIHPQIKPPMIVPPDPERQDLQELPKPLTVSDMPTRFGVFFHGGCSIMIQSVRTTSVLLKNWDAFDGWMSRTYSQLTNWVQRLAGDRSCRLVLEMTPIEVQGLYWALMPSTRIMVHIEG